MFKRFLSFIFFLSITTTAVADEPLITVDQVELDRYTGKWFEIARIDHGFQKGCINSTAEYAVRDDGDIKVTNRCYVPKKNEYKKAVGRAWIKDKKTNSKLRVQFFLSRFKVSFLSGNYWILALDDDYQHVMVGSPDRDYLWILARDSVMDSETLKALVDQAIEQGFDRERILFNPLPA